MLAGLIYAVGAYALERSRQATCVSNLRQIGMALKMYMEDYKRADWDVEIEQIDTRQITVELSNQLVARWGFPDSLMNLVHAGYIRDKRILRCGSTRYPFSEEPVHYFYQIPVVLRPPEDSPEPLDPSPLVMFQKKQYSYPIVVDMHMGNDFHTFIILRMNHSTQIRRLSLREWIALGGSSLIL